MTRSRPGIGSELLIVLLILSCVAGSWLVVVALHRRAAADSRKARESRPVVAPVAVAPPPVAVPAPPPPAPRPVPPPPEDPTRQALRALHAAEAEQILEAQELDRKAESLERARQAALAEAERWRRRELLVRAQVDRLDQHARSLEQEADDLERERDVLAQERDAARAALVKARSRTSYAVVPHKGPNGTWRCPIIIECRNGTVTLQPHGPTLNLLEISISGLMDPRLSPLVGAVARELIRLQAVNAPDGATIVPYIFFVVRPDGIRPYYEARARLEPLGIAFGYELVDQDWEIDYPDLDHPENWGGSSGTSAPGRVAGTGDRPWPENRTPAGGGASDDSFIWPTRPRGGPGGSGDGPEPFARPGRSPAGGTGRSAVAGLGLGSDAAGPTGPPGGSSLLGGRSPRDDGTPRTWGGPSPRGGEAGGGPGPAGLVAVSPGALPGFEDPTPRGGTSLPPLPSPTGGGGQPAAPRDGPGPWGGDEPSQSDASLGQPRSPFGSGNPARGATSGGDPRRGTQGPGTSNGASEANGSEPFTNAGSQSGGRADSSRGAPASGLGPSASGAPAGNSGSGLGLSLPKLGSSAGTSDAAPGGTGPGSESSATEGREGRSSSGGGAASWADRHLKVAVPLEIVVACGPDGVVLHPGGYRISRDALAKEGRLERHLQAIVQQRRQVDPLIRPVPSLRFLVEARGGDTYLEARRQVVVSGLDWPVSLRVADSNVRDVFPKERW